MKAKLCASPVHPRVVGAVVAAILAAVEGASGWWATATSRLPKAVTSHRTSKR